MSETTRQKDRPVCWNCKERVWKGGGKIGRTLYCVHCYRVISKAIAYKVKRMEGTQNGSV